MQASPAPAPAAVELSVVIPVLDEVEALDTLHGELTAALGGLGRDYEILFVDDGSRDGSADKLDALAAADPRVRVVHLRKNFGKSAALAAGFERVRGDIVITLDADLQDDPALIPRFVARIEAGADLVSGWKQRRRDPFGKRWPSRLFNAVQRRVSGVGLHDFNCGFKAYRLACIRELSVYGGFHRFLPVLAAERGFRIEELVVNHRARRFGRSKYGWTRLLAGLFDFLTVVLLTRYRSRPLHFFGLPGAVVALAGGAICTYLTVQWFRGHPIGHRPLLNLGVLLVIMGGQFLGLGLLAELLVRSSLRGSDVYSVRSESGRTPPPGGDR